MRQWSAALLVALIAVPSSVQAEGMIEEVCGDCAAPYGSAGPMARDKVTLHQVALAAHNEERRRWKVPPLRWDDRLSADAAAYAQRLSRSGILRHSSDNRQGENLWMGTRGAYGFHHMMNDFLAEKRYYVARAVPAISTTGRWEDVGHYSQMIWRTTTAVGCALASNRYYDFLVCRYDPAGNVWGVRADEGDTEVSLSMNHMP